MFDKWKHLRSLEIESIEALKLNHIHVQCNKAERKRNHTVELCHFSPFPFYFTSFVGFIDRFIRPPDFHLNACRAICFAIVFYGCNCIPWHNVKALTKRRDRKSVVSRCKKKKKGTKGENNKCDTRQNDDNGEKKSTGIRAHQSMRRVLWKC